MAGARITWFSSEKTVLEFFALTYLVSWTFFAGAAFIARGTLEPAWVASLATPVLLVGVFAPSLVAVALTARTDGHAAVARLLRRAVEGPAEPRWYVFAVTYIAAIKLAAALLHRLAAGAWPVFGQQTVLVMAGAIVVSTPVQAGEEIGWRGYALPRLARRFGFGPASIVLGVIWACWHLPLFFMPLPGSDTVGQSFPVYVVQVTAISVAMAWLYWRTHGSLLITMLMHAAVNNTKDIVPSAVPDAANPWTLNASLVAWLTAMLLWTCAVYFLSQMRRASA